MTDTGTTVDPPSPPELLALVERFLLDDLLPALADDRLRFQTRVAANLLRMVAREIEVRRTLAQDQDGRLMPLEMLESFGSVRALTDSLAAGQRSVTDAELNAALQRYVAMKLRIAAPEVLEKDARHV